MSSCKPLSELVAGDTLNFLVALAGYPADDGWTLKYRLVPQDAAGDAIDLTAVAEGTSYRVSVAPAVTATWAAGFYACSQWVEKTGERVTLSRGAATITPDPSALAPGYDGRSDDRKALDAIEAVIAKRASLDQERYRINNRELWRTPIADLMKLASMYRARVRMEEARACGRSGWGSVKVTF